MALHKPARNTKQACTRDLQSTCTDPDDCADGISLLKYSILKLSKIDVSEEVNSVNKSKPELTRPPSINDLSLQACQDGKLKGFEPTMCNTYQTCAEATLKPSCDSQKSSLMELPPKQDAVMKQQSKNMLYLQDPNTVAQVLVADPAKGRKLNYEELEDRMKTFKLPPQWDGPVDYQSMAEAGFVYTGQEDLVCCFSCNVKLDRWSKDLEPLLRHKEESPTCSFMRQKLQAVKKGKTKSVVAPSKPLNSRLTSSIGELQSSSLITPKAVHAVVTGLNEPRLSYGGSVDDRPGAFLPITPSSSDIKQSEQITAYRIQPEGYVTDLLDGVRHSLRNEISPDQNSSDFIKRPPSIDKNGSDIRPPPSMKLRDSSKNSNVLSLYPSIDKTSQHSIENSTIRSKDNQSMQLPSAVEPSSSDIKLPPDMKSRGSSSSPVDTRVEAIPGIRYPSSWRQHRSISPQRASKKISEDSSESFHSAESHGPDYNILSSINPPKTKIMYEESLSEGMENNISIKTSDSKGDDMATTGMGLCQICYKKKIDCIFLPCGHARTCEGCATRIKNSGQPCPYCRKGVSTTYRIYL